MKPEPNDQDRAAVGSGAVLGDGVEAATCPVCEGQKSYWLRLGHRSRRMQCQRCGGTGCIPRDGTRSHSVRISDHAP